MATGLLCSRSLLFVSDWFWEDDSSIPHQQYWNQDLPHHSVIPGKQCVTLVSYHERALDYADCSEKKKYICKKHDNRK
jgi:hypothetical protein